MICRLCDSPINAETIGRPGGCNPVPLAFSETASGLRIAAADLLAGAGRFNHASR